MTPPPTGGSAADRYCAIAVSPNTPRAAARGRFWRRGAASLGRTLERMQGAGWAFADQCVVSAANFITVYLFARHLGATEFGVFMLAHAGLLLLTSVQNALLIQPHNVLAAGLPTPEYRRFTGALVLAQAIACLAICVALGVAGLLVARHSPAAGRIVVVLAVAAMPWLAQEFVRRVLYTRGETRAAAINDLVSYGLQLAGAAAVVFLLADRASPEAALAVLGGSSLIAVLLGVWQLRDHVRWERGDTGPLTRAWLETWRFGKWLTAQNALVWIGLEGGTWIVGLLLGAAQVGVLRAATHLVNVMNPLCQATYSYLPSRASLAYRTGGAAGLARFLRRTQWLLLAAILPFVVTLVGFPTWVLEIAYGGKYDGAQMPLLLALAALAQCVMFMKFPYDLGVLAFRQTRSLFFVYLLPVAVLFSVGIGLIVFLGVVGVPLSILVSNVALLIATRIAYLRHLKRREAGAAD